MHLAPNFGVLSMRMQRVVHHVRSPRICALLFAAMDKGEFPNAQFGYGGDWIPGVDDYRASVAGLPMAFIGVLLWIKGDWEAFVSCCGFPTWSCISDPCFLCWAEKFELSHLEHTRHDHCPWPLKTYQEYDADCRRCEVWIFVRSPAVHRLLLSLLRAFKSKTGGPRGRALKDDIPALNLRQLDRLEPHSAMRDTRHFDTLEIFDPPVRILFWRRSMERSTRHRCPLFDGHL